MSSFRITSELARLIRMPGRTGPATLPKGPEAPTRPGRDDNFRTQQPAPTGHPVLGSEARGPVKSVEELVPPGLEQVPGQEELAHKFASDAALLAAHLKPAQLTGSERATRLWAFYAAYATAAAAKPPQEEAKQAFREALQGQGFAELRDARTAENGVDRGLWVLAARTPDEARERIATVRLEPPPDIRHSEAAGRKEPPPGERAAEQALSLPAGARLSDAIRGTAVPVTLENREPGQEEDPEALRKRGSNRRLGPAMLWNVLHRFRSDPEDGAVAQAHWDRAAFGAVLALAAIALLVIALVSL